MLLLVFALSLLGAALISERLHRTILSTAVLFLVVGFLVGDEVLHLVVLDDQADVVEKLAEVALFVVLFTDGMRAGLGDLRRGWRLPGRALSVGFPLSVVVTAALAHWVAGLSWGPSFLIGAVLAPTDPVFAAAVVGREEVPHRLRQLLNIESGVNDGLALPLVLALLSMLSGRATAEVPLWQEVVVGIAIGIVVPWLASRVERTRYFAANDEFAPLYAAAVGLTVFAVAAATHGNLFLAAFFAGSTMRTVAPDLSAAFHQFGGLVGELLKLLALLVFGALISPTFLAEVGWRGWAFAVLALVAVRPVSLGIALIGSALDRRERITAAWFGPKGFASVVYALIIVESHIETASEIFHLAAATILLSMITHSSTDVLVARWFREEEAEEARGPEARR